MADLLPGAPVTDLHTLGPAETLGEYQARGGYQALREARTATPEQIITAVRQAGLAGRGGANYPAAAKWEAARAHPGPRYLVINAAEGEPGSYKDRHLLARAPHQVIEGALLAAQVTDAEQIIIYLNSEFAPAADALTGALAELQGSDLASALPPVRIAVENHIYIAGEETALLAVLMGRPAWPWPKPPYPTQSGYLGQPTVVHNPETLAHIPLILRHGPDWYRAHQPALYSLTGDITRPGVYELPLGIPAADLLTAAGGPLPGDHIQALLPGGYSLPPLPATQLHTPLAPAALQAAGTGLGASLIAVGNRTGLGLAAAKIAAFFARETCAQCPICVTGTAQIAQALRPAATRPLTPDQARNITTLATEHQGKGICTLLHTSATIAATTTPHLTTQQDAAPVG